MNRGTGWIAEPIVQLQRHARELAVGPAEWMPWNYRQTLDLAGVG